MNTLSTTIATIYEAFGKGDIPTILSALDDHVQWEAWADNSAQKAGVPWLKAGKGKEGALDFFKVVSTFKITDFRVLSIMEGPNQVVVEVVIEAETPAGGSFRDEELHLWTFNNAGKVTRMRHYTDTAKHIAASKMVAVA